MQTNLPQHLDYKVEVLSLYEPIKIDINNFYIKKAEAVLRSVFSQSVFYKYSWSGLAIVQLLEKIVATKFVFVPLVNEDSNAHGVDENFDIELIKKWFQFSYAFLIK